MSNSNIIKPPKRLTGDLESVVRHIYDQINMLSNATNRAATGEARDRTGGKSGNIQLVHDKASGQYGIEGRFDEGWMRFGLGEGVLVQSNQKNPFIPPPDGGSGKSLSGTIQDIFPPITRLRLHVQPGVITSLPIYAIGVDAILKANDIITIASLNGYVATFVVSADVASAATSISVQSKVIGKQLMSGSAVYLTQKSLGTWISELENSITIGAGINNFDVIARVDGNIATTVTSISLKSALTVTLRNGWKILVTDLSTGTVYTCTVNGTMNIGSTSISVTSVALNVADNSPIRLDQLSLLAYINIAADGVLISANALRGSVFIGKTLIAEAGTGKTSVTVANPGILLPLKNGDIVYVVSSTDQTIVNTFTINGNYPAGGSFFFNSATVNYGANSDIYLSGASFSAGVNVKFDEIALSVKKDVFRDYLNGTLIGKVNSPGSTFSIQSPGLTIPVYAGDVLRFVHNEEAGQTLSGNPTIYRTITNDGKVSDTPPLNDAKNPYPVGRTSNISGTGSGTMHANMFVYMETAGPYRVGSSINLYLDEIVFDTNRIRSSNYVAGTSGWTINDDGSAEFSNITVRGNIKLDDNYQNVTNPTKPNGPGTVVTNSKKIEFGSIRNAWLFRNVILNSTTGITDYSSGYFTDSTTLPVDHYESFFIYGPTNVSMGYAPAGTNYPNSGVNLNVNGSVSASGFFYSGGNSVPRIFSGVSVPGAVSGSDVNDFYRRTGTEEVYIKTSNTPTWLKIGPWTNADFVTYTQSTGNPSSTVPNGTLYYDTTNAKAHIRISDSWFPLFNGIKKAYNTSNTYLGQVMVWRGFLSSAPSNPELGHMYKSTTDGSVYVYDGSWQSII